MKECVGVEVYFHLISTPVGGAWPVGLAGALPLGEVLAVYLR
jgi:hypothetical protein